MLYDINYIVTPGLLKQQLQTAADTTLVLEIDPADNNGIHTCYQAVEQYVSTSTFCLLINLQQTLTPEQVTAIMAFFFFSTYHKPGDVPKFFVTGKNEDLITEGVNLIQQNARYQAFSSVQVIPASALVNSYSAQDASAITAAWKTRLQSPILTTDAIFIKVASQEQLTTIQQLLQAEETLFEQQQPALFTLKKQNRQLQQQVQQLEHLYKAAQREIGNQVSHNQILRSSSHATALQNYYNNEYEVLPLWYKRLGHIIKVLIGKRSLKSLYSDNAKKYRN